jgi:hypothetical protein
MFQFQANLKKVKLDTVQWAKEKFRNSQQDLVAVESHISQVYENNNSGIFSEDEVQKLKKWWHQKCRVI